MIQQYIKSDVNHDHGQLTLSLQFELYTNFNKDYSPTSGWVVMTMSMLLNESRN